MILYFLFCLVIVIVIVIFLSKGERCNEVNSMWGTSPWDKDRPGTISGTTSPTSPKLGSLDLWPPAFFTLSSILEIKKKYVISLRSLLHNVLATLSVGKSTCFSSAGFFPKPARILKPRPQSPLYMQSVLNHSINKANWEWVEGVATVRKVWNVVSQQYALLAKGAFYFTIYTKRLENLRRRR